MAKRRITRPTPPAPPEIGERHSQLGRGIARASKCSAVSAIKLNDVCRRFDVSAREALYALSQSFTPTFDVHRPGSGNHRQFSAEEVLALVLMLQLKGAGMKMPSAAAMARWFVENCVTAGRRAGGSDTRAECDGAEERHYLEIADAEWVRLRRERVSPSRHSVRIGPWINVHSAEKSRTRTPLVVVQVDINGLADKLEGWNCPTLNRWSREVF